MKQGAIDAANRQAAASAAAKQLITHPIFTESNHIACYLARDNEFDTTPIIQLIWQTKKKCYLPIVSSPEDAFLHFVTYQENDPLLLNRYRILEPSPDVAIMHPTERLDLVFVPLLAFDSAGYRLGSGGGYYDRTFAFLLQNKPHKPLMIGLGYQHQQLTALPHDGWDVPLDGVLTEERFILF